MADNIEFKIINPVDKGEEWALEYGSTKNTVEIYINNIEIIRLLKNVEESYALSENHPSIAGAYGHISPEILYSELTDKEKCAFLLCCNDCGDIGCWSVSVHIKEDENYVYWYDFEHNHRDWEYDLSFKFIKKDYIKALDSLLKYNIN